MVRNIVVLGGSSHPSLNAIICEQLGIPQGNAVLTKFSGGETRVVIGESVRGKDVYIIQPSAGQVNDMLMELLICISACKTASARKVTAVLPLFPYSRQSDVPYEKTGPALSKSPSVCESKPQTPHPDRSPTAGLSNGIDGLQKDLSKMQLDESNFGHNSAQSARDAVYGSRTPRRSDTLDSTKSDISGRNRNASSASMINGVNGTSHESESNGSSRAPSKKALFYPQPGYRPWVAQAGTLVADLLTAAGADHVITMELHDPQYQGFLDIPVDNLYGRGVLKKYIKTSIPDYEQAVVVSPDAGGAKRATAIADSLQMPFALIHKERRPTRISDKQNSTMMLVGDVSKKTCILIDDLADTANTITRAAKLLKREGATTVYALITHGVLSGDAIEKINASFLDKVVVTNSVPQEDHLKCCPKLKVLDVGHIFAEAIRRVHHGESISTLFQYD